MLLTQTNSNEFNYNIPPLHLPTLHGSISGTAKSNTIDAFAPEPPDLYIASPITPVYLNINNNNKFSENSNTKIIY